MSSSTIAIEEDRHEYQLRTIDCPAVARFAAETAPSAAVSHPFPACHYSHNAERAAPREPLGRRRGARRACRAESAGEGDEQGQADLPDWLRHPASRKIRSPGERLRRPA